MLKRILLASAILLVTVAAVHPRGQARQPASAPDQEILVNVELQYREPSEGAPTPNFSPKGMQVPLASVRDGVALPAGAMRPAKTGVMKIGPSASTWMTVLVSASAKHPQELCQLSIDHNRNGDFTDDGEAFEAEPSQNAKTRAWWSSFKAIRMPVSYVPGRPADTYQVNAWIVREEAQDVPDILRFSVASWRAGEVTIQGVKALVAVMDADNNAIFDKNDMWSVLEASAPNAEKQVLSIAEARSTSRMMFVRRGGPDLVLEFRSLSPDGRTLAMAVMDRPVSKADDRKADDALAEERSRPRTNTPFVWGRDLNAALAQAKASGRKVFVDFQTDWCGPCKTMDEWIYTDADVAAALNAGYIGVQLDGDIEKALVKQFTVGGYPTMVVVDGAGKELWRVVGYQSSKELLAALTRR